MKNDYLVSAEFNETPGSLKGTGLFVPGKVISTAEKTLFNLTLTILFSFCFFQQESLSQTLGVGLGKTSDGQCPAKLIVKDALHGFGAYIKYTDNNVNFLDDRSLGLVKTESDELCAGITYRVHEMITLFTGVGRNLTIDYFNSEDQKRYLQRSKSSSFEIGFNANIIDWSWGELAVDASINNYSGVNSLIILGIKLTR